MNPAFSDILHETLSQGYSPLILTNAIKPMRRPRVQTALVELLQRFKSQITIRVNLMYWQAHLHDAERGFGVYRETLDGLHWLEDHAFNIAIAARLRWGDKESDMRPAYAILFNQERLQIDARNAEALVLCPEMVAQVEAPEITIDCRRILNKSHDDMMCASSRMIIKHKSNDTVSVATGTLLPNEQQFD